LLRTESRGGLGCSAYEACNELGLPNGKLRFSSKGLLVSAEKASLRASI